VKPVIEPQPHTAPPVAPTHPYAHRAVSVTPLTQRCRALRSVVQAHTSDWPEAEPVHRGVVGTSGAA
jgi:hypothetical protein